MRYCAVCCMAKDEEPFIREWVAYHLLLGFDHCIVVDDASARPVAGLLDGWATPDLVTVVRHETPQGQNATYERCLERFGGDFFWMAFLDVDEFIRCANPWPGMADAQWAGQADIRAVLGAYEPYGAVGVNWRMFSWSGHDRRPAGLVMDNYIQCLGDDMHVKSVVRPAAVRSCATPHSFCLRPGWSAVDAGRFPLPDGFPFAVPQTRLLAVNHYYFKSREDFRQKVARGNPVRIPRHMEEFEGHVSRPATEDAGLRPFVAPVRDLLGRPELRLNRPATGLVEPGACRDALRAVAEDIRRGGGRPRRRGTARHACAPGRYPHGK